MEEDPLKIWQHIHGASVHFPLAMAVAALVARIAPTRILAEHRESFIRLCVY